MSHQEVFSSIYSRKIWHSKGVLSGEGARLENNLFVIAWLERQADEGLRAVTDMGCGDLEWISHCDAITSGRIAYHGVDVVPTLIGHHRRVFPWFSGESADIESVHQVDVDIVILKDVLPHLCNGHAGQILMHAERLWKWKRLLVTSHPGADPLDRRRCSGKGDWRPFDVEASGVLESAKVVERLHRSEGEYLVYERS